MPTTSGGRSPMWIGTAVLLVAALAMLLLFQKSAIITALRPGETLALEMPRNYKVDEYATVVKIAGSPVGVVSSVDDAAGGEGVGGVLITLKLDHGTRELLGTTPSAEIRPTTILGGKYYVSLVPGGDRGTYEADTIPRERTSTPVELDRVLAAVPPEAQDGLQGGVERLDSALEAGAGESLAGLAGSAPAVLEPAAPTLDALRGTRPDTDLLETVTGLDRTAHVLTATPGQLRAVVDSLAGTAKVLGDNADPVARTVETLPDVLRASREGALRLAPTLDLVTDMAADARPAVRELDPLLERLDPALAELRPVLAELRPLLADVRPLVEQLTPTLDEGTSVVRDVRGPVIERVNGPVVDTLLAEWRGDAPKYTNGGATGNKFYEELGYMFANINYSVQYFNATAHMLGFQPGAGTTSVTGTGDAAQSLQNALSQMFGPPHEQPPLQLPPAEGVSVPDLLERAGG